MSAKILVVDDDKSSVETTVEALERAKRLDGVTLLHFLTEKGKGFAPAADTYETLIIALEDTAAHFYRLDSNGYQSYKAAQTTGPAKDVALTPWVFTQTREGSDEKTVTVDFIRVWQRRTVS